MEDEPPSGPADRPLDASATLTWMGAHGDLLRQLVAEETEGEDAAPASDGAVRAHLRFLAAALEATAAPDIASALAGLDDDLPMRFALGEDLLERHIETGAGAIALEQHLQHGTSPGSDPSLDVAFERRVRVGGWIQLFLVQVEERLGPSGDGLAAAVSAELDRRNRDLSRMIFLMFSQARQSLRQRLPAEPSTETLDEVGQASMVQAHSRMLVEVLADVLAERGGPHPLADAGLE